LYLSVGLWLSKEENRITKNLKTLITQAQSGDLHAFRIPVHRFQDMAVGCAYSMTGDFFTAETRFRQRDRHHKAEAYGEPGQFESCSGFLVANMKHPCLFY
jgi:hypothetical protein